MNNKYTTHRLEVGKTKSIPISCRQYYFLDRLSVKEGEKYSFEVDIEVSRWWDMIIPKLGEG